MLKNELKICKDCKYADPSTYWCVYPIREWINLATGNPESRTASCNYHREDGWISCRTSGTCGKEGRFYVKK